MQKVEVDSIVALLRDIPEEGLVRGQVGAVVKQVEPDQSIVEFCDDYGETYAIPRLPYDALMVLHYGPAGGSSQPGAPS